jgi:hypothetical protein
MKRIKTKRLTRSRYRFLHQCGYTADSVFSDWNAEEIKAKLLAVGGQAVIIAGSTPEDCKELVVKGEFVSGEKLKMWKMAEGRCHQNVEYIITRWPHFKGLTGFALSEDGVWRFHSWAFDPKTNCIRETTQPRLMYFGIPF